MFGTKIVAWMFGGVAHAAAVVSWWSMVVIGQTTLPDVFMWVVGVFMTLTLPIAGWVLLMVIGLLNRTSVTNERLASLKNNLDEKFTGAISAHGRITKVEENLSAHLADEKAHRPLFRAHGDTLVRHSESIKRLRERMDNMGEKT